MGLFDKFKKSKEGQTTSNGVLDRSSVGKIEAEYQENLYSVDYKGERTPLRTVPRREWTNVSSVEEKIDNLSVIKRKTKGRTPDVDEKIDKLFAKKFKK